MSALAVSVALNVALLLAFGFIYSLWREATKRCKSETDRANKAIALVDAATENSLAYEELLRKWERRAFIKVVKP